jgi:hypothetical protein
LPLIKAGYIVVVCADPPTVYEPPPAAVEWLKSMLAPLLMRPFLSLEDVGLMESLPVNEVRRLALGYDVPIHFDACFGELFTVAAFRRLHAALHYHREPSRFDRQALLTALLRASGAIKEVEPPPFSKRLDREIQRIAQLDEPHRTEQALRLLNQYNDAQKVAGSIAAAKGLPTFDMRAMSRVEKIVEVVLPSDPDLPS